jgi:nitroreductase
METRYSVRAYRSDPVPDSLLAEVLEAARLAPTAANRQPFRCLVLQTEQWRAELRRIYPRAWFVQAPLVLGMLGVPAEAWVRRDGVSYYLADATIALDHLVLRAAELGLGTCWIAAFDAQAAREVLALPQEVEPLFFTPLGFAADQPTPKVRRPLRELVHYDGW